MLRLLLFSLYIKDLHNSVNYARAYYFADIFKDLFNLSNWLNVNKLNLNSKKTEFVIFRSRKLKMDHSFKFKLACKRLVPTKSVKYLRVLLEFGR